MEGNINVIVGSAILSFFTVLGSLASPSSFAPGLTF